MNAWGLQKGLRNNNQVEKKDIFPINFSSRYICYALYYLVPKVKNTHGRVLLLVKQHSSMGVFHVS